MTSSLKAQPARSATEDMRRVDDLLRQMTIEEKACGTRKP